MAETIEEVKTFKVSMKCDKCGKGFMKLIGGTALTSDPPLYKHRCIKCGHEEFYNKQYPYLDTRPVRIKIYSCGHNWKEDDGK